MKVYFLVLNSKRCKAESIPQGIAKTVWMILLLKIHALNQLIIFKSY